MKFEVVKKSKKTRARAGVLQTPHGTIETPVFMPVGTQGAVKALIPEMLDDMNAQVILGNTYHLALRPGQNLIAQLGGLHKFIGWKKPILTDSGGYQIFSLAGMRRIGKNGVEFKSHLDGLKHFFSPRSVIDLQMKFGSDIMMPLDICSSYGLEKKQVNADLEITHAWETEAKLYYDTLNTDQLLFGLVQGGFFHDLREKSAEIITKLDFPGYAIGGVSVGEPLDEMQEMTEFTAKLLPDNKPRYLMGVGLPENMKFSIQAGIDMFDCVAPTRLARHGHAFTQQGNINIRNKKFENDQLGIDPKCDCFVCRKYSRAYIRHLFRAKEITAIIMLSYHNVYFMIKLVANFRQSILDGTL